jgi:hypothetical protein
MFQDVSESAVNGHAACAQIPMGYDMNGMGVIVNSEGTCSSGGSGTDGHVDLNGSCSCWNNWEEPPAAWLKGDGCPADSIAPGGMHTLMPCIDGSTCLKPNISGYGGNGHIASANSPLPGLMMSLDQFKNAGVPADRVVVGIPW